MINKMKRLIIALSIVIFILAGLIIKEKMVQWYEYKKLSYVKIYLADNAQYVIEASEKYKINFIKILSIIGCESQYKKYAVSNKGCKGLMQLSERTAAWLRELLKDEIANLDIFNPEFNIKGGTLFMKILVDKFAKGDFDKAIEFYNIGYDAHRKGQRNGIHVIKYEAYYFKHRNEFIDYLFSWRML